MSLFTEEERWEMYRSTQAKLNAERQQQLAAMKPKPQTRAEKCASDRRVLVQLVAEFPDVSAEELAKASGRSTSWARKVARENGIVLAKPVRRTVQQLKGEKRNDKA